MAFLAGFLRKSNRKTSAELVWVNKRMLNKVIREIERERRGLRVVEKKIIAVMKRSAKQEQMGSVRVIARDLIRTRRQIVNFYNLKSQLQGVSLRIQNLKSTQSMREAMKGVTVAMGSMKLPISLQRIMNTFQKQTEQMGMVSEVLVEWIDNGVEGEGDGEEEENTEELVDEVLDDIGIDLTNQKLVNVAESETMMVS